MCSKALRHKWAWPEGASPRRPVWDGKSEEEAAQGDSDAEAESGGAVGQEEK